MHCISIYLMQNAHAYHSLADWKSNGPVKTANYKHNGTKWNYENITQKTEQAIFCWHNAMDKIIEKYMNLNVIK